MKGKQNLSFWSVKLSQRANRCILWLRKRRENVLFLWVINVFKTVHLQQLIGMQSSKRGMWKRYHLAVEGIQRGCLFSKEWFYKMVRGWTLGIGAFQYKKICWLPSELPPCSTVQKGVFFFDVCWLLWPKTLLPFIKSFGSVSSKKFPKQNGKSD